MCVLQPTCGSDNEFNVFGSVGLLRSIEASKFDARTSASFRGTWQHCDFPYTFPFVKPLRKRHQGERHLFRPLVLQGHHPLQPKRQIAGLCRRVPGIPCALPERLRLGISLRPMAKGAGPKCWKGKIGFFWVYPLKRPCSNQRPQKEALATLGCSTAWFKLGF